MLNFVKFLLLCPDLQNKSSDRMARRAGRNEAKVAANGSVTSGR